MKNQLLSPLQNPLQFFDGTPVRTHTDFARRRQEILDLITEVEFGGMPPKPSELKVEELYTPGYGRKNTYRIHITENGRRFSFTFTVSLPKKTKEGAQETFPVLLTGDACFEYVTTQLTEEARRRGILLVCFNRVELAPDTVNADKEAGIRFLYPDQSFTAISAWAWGYSRVIDALSQLPFVDMTRIGITGHSRGGKTTLLAGAHDERIAFVNANGSGTHGCGCWRYQQQEADGKRSEVMADLFRNFPHWMGEKLQPYIGKEEVLPYDMHLLKACIAPRAFLDSNATGDIWANPKGSYLTNRAAIPAWEFFGCSEKFGTRFREGEHFHTYEDICAFLDFMEGKSICEVPDDYRKELDGIELFR